MTITSTSKTVDKAVKPLTSNDSGREIIARHTGRKTASVFRSDDVELGDISFTSRQGPDRATGSEEIGVRREVDVFADANKNFV